MSILDRITGGLAFALLMFTNCAMAADLPAKSPANAPRQADFPPLADYPPLADAGLEAPTNPARGGEWAVTAFGGFASENVFSKILLIPWETELETDIPWLAASVSKRVGTWGDSIAFELEGGAGYRFGTEDTAEVWGVLYVRYDNFFWNDYLYTTMAASTGLSYASKISPIEREKNDGDGSRLLHYFSPEITFARPSDKNTELVLRLHHRSGAFGLFNGVSSGTNIPTIGLRKRF